MIGLSEKLNVLGLDSSKYAEIYRKNGTINGWGYEGYEIKLVNEEGKESFERVVFSQSDIGNSFLVMELKGNPKEGFFVNKLRSSFAYDNEISFEKAINQSSVLAYVIARSKALTFVESKHILDLVSRAQSS